jgi:Leucine-rich repeat (LRR) protein
MQKEAGDDYVRRIAEYIRTHSQALAGAAPIRRGAPAPQRAQPAGLFGWMSKLEAPLVYSTDLHHIFYLLMRFEELGVDVGPLDVRLPPESISRPLSYVSLLAAKDRSDAASVFSFKSISGVSKMSLGAGWWPRARVPSVEAELKSIYSAFTMLPALAIYQSTLNVIWELADDPPVDHVIPLYAFKNLQTLECVDIDPRLVMGWDRLAESLRSLTVRRSGILDVTEIFIDAVLEDQRRRAGEPVNPNRRRLPHRATDSHRPSWKGAAPNLITPPIRDETQSFDTGTRFNESPSPPPIQLSSLKWAFLKHLSLSDNGLTFFPTEVIPHLLSVSYLDLSSNLLVSVPSGLNQMYNLVTLNLSDNMIESVLGIYTMLGQVLTLNLSRNRIESLCGLERLVALERIDVRKNEVVDIGEVGRLATLPNLQGVWIDGNPFVQNNPDYRITCFNQFLKEGKTVALDGTQPTFMERRYLITPMVPEPQISPGIKPPENAPSPPVVAISAPTPPVKSPAIESTSNPPEVPVMQAPPRKKRPTKRLVDLDGTGEAHIEDVPSTPKRTHRRGVSEAGSGSSSHRPQSPLRPIGDAAPLRKSSHKRGMTVDLSPSPPSRGPSSRSPTINQSSGFATISGNGTISRRRTKLSPAMFLPTAEEPESSPGSPHSKDADLPGVGSPGADAFRAEIEALRASAPDNWLKVLSQKQFGNSTRPEGGNLRVGSPEAKRRRHLRGVSEI